MTSLAPAVAGVNEAVLVHQRRQRLLSILDQFGMPAVLTCDPFSIRYATGTRNMFVHGLTGPDRFALVFGDGYTVLWEFAGCGHLVGPSAPVDDLREAPATNAKKSFTWAADAVAFARELVDLLTARGAPLRLGVDRIEIGLADALRSHGVEILDGTLAVHTAMAIKQSAEVDAMRAAVVITEAAATAMEAEIAPGRTEQGVWAEFHRSLIANGGELVVTRLLQAGLRTFPYFQEASDHVMSAGDLICFDTDAVSLHGYSVDFSRTFLCGDEAPTPRQRELYALAREQLEHNADNLAPGRSFEGFARRAFDVPEPFREYGYYQLAHGLGLAGGYPNVPRADDGAYPLRGDIEPGMVICVESYIGDPVSRQGVKLEDQFLIGEDSVEAMSRSPFDSRLSR